MYINSFSLDENSNCNIRQLLCDELLIDESSWPKAGKISIKNLLCKKLNGTGKLPTREKKDGDQIRIEYSRNGDIVFNP